MMYNNSTDRQVQKDRKENNSHQELWQEGMGVAVTGTGFLSGENILKLTTVVYG